MERPHGSDPLSLSRWERRARALYWVFGLVAGAILTYSTRYYLNSDGINYIEMADAFSRGKWSALVNLTESPGYAFAMGVAMMVWQPDRLSEVPFLKVVNFVGLLAAMASCELFLSLVRREVNHTEHTLPFALVRALAYGLFLFAALDWIRMRLVAPDMCVCAIVLVAMSIVLRIKQTRPGVSWSVLLGGVCGLGYLFKSFFFPFSWVFFGMAALVSGGLRKAVSTMVVAALTMVIVGSPLIVALSAKVGRFSYGEAGNYNYAHFVAGRGEPVAPPERLHQDPEVLGYDLGLLGECTYPAGFDLAAWSLGIRPVFDVVAQARVIPGNLMDIFRQTPWLFLLVPIWFGVQAALCAPRFGPLVPPSAAVMCGVTAMLGISLFSLVVVEIRYVAPFLFLGFVGLLLGARQKGPEPSSEPQPDGGLTSAADPASRQEEEKPHPTTEAGRTQGVCAASATTVQGASVSRGEHQPHRHQDTSKSAGDPPHEGAMNSSSPRLCVLAVPFLVAQAERLRATLRASRTRTILPASLLGVVIVSMCAFSVGEQAHRGSSSSPGKPSYREALYGQWSLARFLKERGLRAGDKVGIVGSVSPYWARLAELKIVVVAPDEPRFLAASAQQRAAALLAAGTAARAMIGYGDGFTALTKEGWQAVPGSLGYWCRVLDRGGTVE
ncbi:MAG: hypothetical protein AB1646_20885 [Thermodesulfobacteriota bacterium]